MQGGHGATAVKCGGSGALQKVRVIHLSKDTLFWFEVHADRPGAISTSKATDSRVLQTLLAKQIAPLTGSSVPVPEGQALAHLQTAPVDQQSNGGIDANEEIMQQRVKAWNTVHHPVVLKN